MAWFMVSIHTSGHASISDLKRLAKAVDAKKIVPIHTFEAKQYPQLFDNVELHNDNEWWELTT